MRRAIVFLALIAAPTLAQWTPIGDMLNRGAIELRYRLLPTIYSAMHDAAESGGPAMRR